MLLHWRDDRTGVRRLRKARPRELYLGISVGLDSTSYWARDGSFCQFQPACAFLQANRLHLVKAQHQKLWDTDSTHCDAYTTTVWTTVPFPHSTFHTPCIGPESPRYTPDASTSGDVIQPRRKRNHPAPQLQLLAHSHAPKPPNNLPKPASMLVPHRSNTHGTRTEMSTLR